MMMSVFTRVLRAKRQSSISAEMESACA